MARSSGEIQHLLSHPQLWRAGMPVAARDQAIASGYEMLDELLAGGGWPRDGLVELLADQVGIGELRLLAPALAALSRQEQRWLIWINPPHIPYAPALASFGLDIEKILLVHPKQHGDALWSLEQALKSGTCSAALGWFDERHLTAKELRRLQLAARQGGTLTALFRPRSAACQPSMAELRVALQPIAPNESAETATPGRDRLEVEIIKRRGGWPVAPFCLPLQPPTVSLTKPELRAHIEGWRIRARHWQTACVPAASAMPLSCQSMTKQLPLALSRIEPVSDVRHA
jgi:protein ImuA